MQAAKRPSMSSPDANPAAQPAAPEPGGELALQRRWAEGRWPSPWLRLEQRDSQAGEQRTAQAGEPGPAPAAEPLGAPLRVCFAGRWNRAAGPDFRDAILLDADGRARRGDIELHRRATGWRQHGHHTDPAYARVLLHVLGAGPDNTQHGAPPAALLPPGGRAAPAPPCADVLECAGPAAVAARLRRLAWRRLQRKAEFLHRRVRPEGESDPDELAAWGAGPRARDAAQRGAARRGARTGLARDPQRRPSRVVRDPARPAAQRRCSTARLASRSRRARPPRRRRRDPDHAARALGPRWGRRRGPSAGRAQARRSRRAAAHPPAARPRAQPSAARRRRSTPPRSRSTSRPVRSPNAGSACPRRATCAPTHCAIGSARTTHTTRTTRTARCAGVTEKPRRCLSSNAAGAARAPAPSVRSAASIAPTDHRRTH